MKKKIYLDPGGFYTKVTVFASTEPGDLNSAPDAYSLSGRTFFPTAAVCAPAQTDRVICYELNETRYWVGGACANNRWNCDDESDAGTARNHLIAELVLRKALFDYCDSKDEVELFVVVDTPLRRQIFEKVCSQVSSKSCSKVDSTILESEIAVEGYRGPQKIRKLLTLKLKILPASDGVLGYVNHIKSGFDLALFVDIGYSSTKLYVISQRQGVEKFEMMKLGARFYSDAIERALTEQGITPLEPYWLMKQIELGCQAIEVDGDGAGQLKGKPRLFDVSLILENARWDTNKDFKRMTTDFITDYYNATSRWVGLLVVTGGGALFNGELLCAALSDAGYQFDDILIDKSPLYTVLEGLAQGSLKPTLTPPAYR